MQTVKFEGITGLYKGMSSPLIGAGIANAFVFTAYGWTRRSVLGKDDGDGGRGTDSLRNVFICGLGAGVGAAVINCPMELVRIKLQIQTQGKENALYKGPIDCIKKMWAAAGIRGPLRGMVVTAMRDVPGFAIYFTSYEWLRRKMTPEGAGPESLSFLGQFAAGGFGGLCIWLATYPIDVVKSRIQSQPDNIRLGIIECAVQSYKKEGWRVFVTGLGTTLARAVPVNAAILLVYEATRKVLH